MSNQSETLQNYIFPESTESAKFVENISGWVDRNGLFFGKEEGAARYSGATHIRCTGCGNVISKNSYCNVCAERKDAEQYMNAPRQEWDGKTPLYSETRDEWYFNKDDLADDAYCFAEENGYLIDGNFDHVFVFDKMMLYLGTPTKLSNVDQDYWCDDLAEDQDLPGEILDALDALNEEIDKINNSTPVSWECSDTVAVID